jgi:hypothetical protein
MRTILLMLLAWVAPAVQAAPAGCGTEGVAVQVLGSGDATLTSKRAGPGALLWVDGKARVLVNAGGGTALRFQESGAHWNDLDAVAFTQMDAAHSADLAALLQAAQAGGRTRALPVYGPAGNKFAPSTVTFVRDLFDPVRGVYRHLGSLLAPLDRSGYKLDPHDVREPPAKLGAPRRKGPEPLPVMKNERIQIQAVVLSPEPISRLAWRVDVASHGVVFGAPGRSSTEMLAAIADGASMLVTPLPADTQVTTLAQLAQRARVKQLVLTGRGATREDDLLAAARKQFAGTTVLADDLACYRP